MPLATSARAAAACSLAGLATDTDGANVLDGASAMTYKEEYNKKMNLLYKNTSRVIIKMSSSLTLSSCTWQQ